MRCYSEREIKRMVRREPIVLHREESVPVTGSERQAIEEESLDVIQLASDLEFEMKFRRLMQSISRRMPYL